jgi:hypothetical protein
MCAEDVIFSDYAKIPQNRTGKYPMSPHEISLPQKTGQQEAGISPGILVVGAGQPNRPFQHC